MYAGNFYMLWTAQCIPHGLSSLARIPFRSYTTFSPLPRPLSFWSYPTHRSKHFSKTPPTLDLVIPWSRIYLFGPHKLLMMWQRHASFCCCKRLHARVQHRLPGFVDFCATSVIHHALLMWWHHLISPTTCVVHYHHLLFTGFRLMWWISQIHHRCKIATTWYSW